jgi:hypothetical protein
MAQTASSLSASIRFTTAIQEALGISGQQQTFSPTQPLALALTNGTGADQFSKYAVIDTSVTAASPNSHDLAGGTIVDLVTSAAVTFSRLVGIVIINYSTSTYLTVGGGSNAVGVLTNSFPIRPSTSSNLGFWILTGPDATGYAVAAGSTDILKVDCGAGTAAYKIHLWGS